MKHRYVHGYSLRESVRLQDQARTLEELLHHDTQYPSGCRVLEIGCGVGAQTVILARSSPDADITSVDISHESVCVAERRIRNSGSGNVQFVCANIYNLPFTNESIDHVFVCFVLEHLRDPEGALREIRRILRTGGSITAIEGDHGSAFFHPDNPYAQRAIQCLIQIQAEKGGDACLGRRLYPLVTDAGFRQVSVSPRLVYADAMHPDLQKGFVRQTFTAMIEGIEEDVFKGEMMDAEGWNEAIAALYRSSVLDGTFCYTFFKVTAKK